MKLVLPIFAGFFKVPIRSWHFENFMNTSIVKDTPIIKDTSSIRVCRTRFSGPTPSLLAQSS